MNIEAICNNCGKDFEKPQSYFKNKSGLYYCSKSCAVTKNNCLRLGERHPNWKGGFRSYRRFGLKNKCESCGEGKYWLLLVHHKDKDRNNNSLENLITLCYNCHAEQHLIMKDGLLQVDWKALSTDEIKGIVEFERDAGA